MSARERNLRRGVGLDPVGVAGYTQHSPKAKGGWRYPNGGCWEELENLEREVNLELFSARCYQSYDVLWAWRSIEFLFPISTRGFMNAISHDIEVVTQPANSRKPAQPLFIFKTDESDPLPERLQALLM